MTTALLSVTRKYQMKLYSTAGVARKLRLSRMTLHRYISAKKITAPPVKRVGGVKVRLWTQRDIEQVRKRLPRIANGRRKKKRKA